ncbi:DUF433 domain-containing protein [Pedobacter gandavensis]|uniref:DUF433 domain-containing protein n=1 Tax=Pedobacter gandavensis TaxID=2679963 RepID=UPI00292F620D|nr:DUF433 domain-containing protein [Pedobacter gandavensis]
MTFNESLRGEFGNGAFSMSEIAFVLGLPKKNIQYWIKELWDGKLGKHYDHKYSWFEGRARMTNFKTLIECYVYAQLKGLNFSMEEIFNAHHVIAEQLNTVHPFATSPLFSDGKSIFFTQNDGAVVGVDPNEKADHKQMINSFCDKVIISTAKHSNCFYPMGKDNHVVIHPHHKFGAPTIENTNIPAEIIADLYDGGESTEFIAGLYDLSIPQVEAAITFFKPKAAI